jgi:alpha-N-arabinofuranosidase
MKYRNPIIPGFYPDPSICRVGEDYYLVNSSFEYFPGVPIFHSKDLVNWHQIGHCLTRKSQLPLERTAPSDGIYAPTIRHHAGRFYLVTTNAVPGSGFRNFYVHSEDPAGEWSEPVWIEQKGIDPSLFFDDDGKVYFTGNGTLWSAVRGAYQSEIDIATGRHLSDIKFIWPGAGGSYPEAPHLFKRNGVYYLMMAEGGTADTHSVTISRSKDPWGPFDPCPHNPILSMRGLMNDIQATGHADFVEDPRGNWWAVFLGIRFADAGVHNLGRETFLAPVAWTQEGWPVVNEGNRILPDMETDKLPPPHPWPAEPVRDDFDARKLRFCWVFLRNPRDEDWSLTERPGSLRLRCSPVTPDDVASPAFVGRRQTHFDCRAAALVDFTPQAENEESGMIALIDNKHHYEIAVTLRNGKRVAVVRRRIGTLVSETVSEPLPDGPVALFIRADRRWYQLGFSPSDGAESLVAKGETRYLSSEVAGGYTGVCLGIYATARGGQSTNAAFFDWFDYEPLS